MNLRKFIGIGLSILLFFLAATTCTYIYLFFDSLQSGVELFRLQKSIADDLIQKIDDFESRNGIYPSSLTELSSVDSHPLVPGFSGIPYFYQANGDFFVIGYMKDISKYDIDVPICLFDSRRRQWECGADNFGPFELIPTAFPDNFPTRSSQ